MNGPFDPERFRAEGRAEVVEHLTDLARDLWATGDRLTERRAYPGGVAYRQASLRVRLALVAFGGGQP